METLKKRKRTVEHGDLVEFERLTKKIRKDRKQDIKEHTVKTPDKNLDLRDRWLGTRQLKSNFAPTPYHNRDKQGKHIPWKDRA